MAMVVKNNMSAISTLNTLNRNSASLTKSLAKVSSGMRINGAADDASGYAISERMRVQIRSLDQDNRNTQNGNSMMKVAEGAVSSTVEILKTLKEKVINAANDTNTDADRATVQKELDQSIDQIDDNANMTYNGKYLVDGSKNKAGDATYTSLTNQSLSTDTTAATKLTELKSRSGDDLQIQSTDKITVSYVQQGKTYSTSFQVGDKTLQDIFTEAENIDTNSKTFAAADNKSVASALDTKAANSADKAAVDATVNYLRSALGRATTEGTVGAAASMSSGLEFTTLVSATNDLGTNPPNYTLKVSTADKTDDLGTKRKVATSLGTVNGEIYKDLKSAANAATTAYSALKSQTDVLKNALANEPANSAQHTWDGEPGSLDNDAIQSIIANGNEQTKAAYATYKENLQAWKDADAKAKEALSTYNSSLNELSALEKEKTYLDKRSTYDKNVNTMLTDLEDAASDTSKEVKYTDADGKVQTSAAGDKSRSAFIKDMVNDLRSQLTNADVAGTADAATAIVQSITIDGAAATADTQVAPFSNSAGNVLTAGGDVNDAYGKLKDASTDLERAHSDQLKKFTGPQLISGSDIGIDGSGKKISTASGDNAITVTAANSGVEGQIAGFTIRITDENDNTKKSAQASLDDFNETIRGQNKSEDNAISLQTGTKANQTIRVALTDMRSQALGLKGSDGSTLNIGTRENANAAINVLDNALQKALDQQTTIGAVQSRLEYTSSNLTTASENVTASESTIRDADMAKEMTEYTKNNVLLQAAQSMLSQANQNSSAVLSLLQ